MPPPPLFTHTTVRSTPARRAASRPPTSWTSATSPVSTNVGRPDPMRRAGRRRHHAVDAVGAAPGEEAQRLGRCREERLHVADRHRVAEPHERVVRQRRLEGGGDPALERLGHGGQRGWHERVGAPPGLDPGAGPASPGSAASASSSGPGGAADHQRRLARGVVPALVRVHHDLLRSREPGPQRLRHGRLAHAQHQSGRCSRGERLGAQQHVVVGHHVRAVVRPAAHTRGRVGQHRPAARGGQAGHRLGHRSSVGVAAHDHAARATPVQARAPGPRGRARRRAGSPRSTGARRGAPPNPPRRAPRPPGASGSRSGKLRCTGPGPATDGGGQRRGTPARGGARRWRAPGSWLPTSTNHLAARP